MLWCFASGAILFILLALGVLTFHPLRLCRSPTRLAKLLRGCLAMLFLLAAIALIGLALLTAQP
jgi:hypothetical protein